MSPEQEQTIDVDHLARQDTVTIEQLMTSAPVCVGPETSAPEIIKLIYTKPFHHLPVVDGNNALVGVISDRDVVRCFCRGTGIAGVTAADIMSTELETISPDTPLKEAVAMMQERGISSLPVLAGSKLVGILTDSDLWSLLHTLLGIMEERHAKA